MIGTDPKGEHLLAAGAALGDLEPAEEAAWAAHRAGCDDCRALEGDLGLVLADLALAVPERMPPPGLLDAVRRSISALDAGATGRGASGAAVPQGPAPVSPAPVSLEDARARRASRGTPLALLGLAAAFAIVAVGFGARSMALQGDLQRAGAEATALEARVSGRDAVMAAAMDPGHVTVALHAEPVAPAATATVMFVPGTNRAYLVARDLPATPAGHGYQLWYADAAGVHPLQTVPFDGVGAFVAPLDVDLGSAAAVMVTLEVAGGATGEPGPQVVFGEL